MPPPKNKPVVLCFSGLDPTGGAGIQADIEAIASHHAHAASIITALTVQDTHNVYAVEPVNAQLITEQADTVLDDIEVSAIKIGMLSSTNIALAIHHIIKKHPHIPVIFDPVLAAGGGTELADTELIHAIIELIVPLCFIITPNTLEAQKLTHENKPNKAAQKLLNHGAKNVLITGTHAPTQQVEHKLFYNHALLNTYYYSRLENEYHGSGCTLTASIAALIAHQQKTEMAIQHALDYSYASLVHANKLGSGQLIPQRYLL
jgi:hydroxymethylpyrimidine/phosphomethylpyrimidine kinase